MKLDTDRFDVSVVVPAFNEAEGLPRFLEAIDRVLKPLDVRAELVFVNDGSRDATEFVLQEIAAHRSDVVPVNFSRNFGKEAAMAAGLAVARGDCVVFMDADLQHPPEVLVELLAKWREGYDVVNGRKRRRGQEPLAYKAFANTFNGLMSRAVGGDMAGASDFKLLDRQVVDTLLEFPERNRFFRGMVTWVGYRVADVEFDVQERELGSTKWSLGSLVRYSLNNLLAFSSLPLVAVAYVGFVTAGLGVVLLLQTLFRYFTGSAAIGFTTVIAVEVMLGGMILTALGVIAVYLARMYDEQKGRPMFIIRRPRGPLARRADVPGTPDGAPV
ncbi:glycosyltransferase family 2 protein [Zoogloea sp.]|uniref:glycosyltransferase family 2 protein n=1 Tax=Zoogloea sp. TaxID=49181 RepID=UPI002BDAD757|nr:glycosyltransferase family 2 protein [Zoogloea sp.]HQA11090.1 glycosyltransferase family 2 protein [Zoogloea sp.]